MAKKKEPKTVVSPAKPATPKPSVVSEEKTATPMASAVSTTKPKETESAEMGKPPEKNSSSKNLMVVILLILAVALVYYFFNQSTATFSPGTSVDQQTFNKILSSASKIYVVMDLRGVKDIPQSDSILQCGVDYAGSSGMGGKTVIPMSLNDSGCVEPDGNHPVSDCISQLSTGLTIYVQSGSSGAHYYTNGVVVSPGSNYTVGGNCKIT